MKLTWHIIRNDIFTQRWALLPWVTFIVAQVVLGLVAQGYDGADVEMVRGLKQVNGVLMFLQFATGYLLVTRFVHADALTGTRMFWVTRPISAQRLLAAKVGGVLLVFALLPVVLLLPWWLWCGFGARDVLWAAVDAVGWQLLMIAPAFLVASLTDDLGRSLIWSLVVFAALGVGILTLQAKLGVSFGDSYRNTRSGALFTRLWLAGVVLVIGAGAVVMHQYLTRRSVRSVLLTVSHFGLVVLVGSIHWGDWSESFDGINLVAPAPTPAGLEQKVTLSVESAGEAGYNVPLNPLEAQKELEVILRVRGVPEDVKFFGEGVVHHWHWAGSLDFKSGGYASSYGWRDQDARVLRTALGLREPVEDPETSQWRLARFEERNAERVARGLQPQPLPVWSRIKPDDTVLRTHLWLKPSILARLKTEPSTYELTMQGVFARAHIAAEVSAKAGSRGSGESQVFQVREQEDGQVVLVTTTPAVKKTGLWQAPMGKRSGWKDYYFRDRLMLVNRVTGDVTDVGGGNNDSPRFIQVGGVVIDWNGLKYYPNSVRRGDQWVKEDPQWLDHSSLVLISDQEVARFTCGLKADKFTVKPSASTPGQDRSY